MIEIKKSKFRVFVAILPILAFSLMIWYNGAPARLAEVSVEQTRAKYRIFHKVPVEIRSYIGRGAGIIILFLPLWFIFRSREYPFYIQINSDFSGRIIYKYKMFKDPTYKDFASYQGQLSYSSPYIYFDPPLKFVDGASMEKLFLPNCWLLKGGKKTIADFAGHVNKQ